MPAFRPAKLRVSSLHFQENETRNRESEECQQGTDERTVRDGALQVRFRRRLLERRDETSGADGLFVNGNFPFPSRGMRTDVKVHLQLSEQSLPHFLFDQFMNTRDCKPAYMHKLAQKCPKISVQRKSEFRIEARRIPNRILTFLSQDQLPPIILYYYITKEYEFCAVTFNRAKDSVLVKQFQHFSER